jgi:hypothetical protein
MKKKSLTDGRTEKMCLKIFGEFLEPPKNGKIPIFVIFGHF